MSKLKKICLTVVVAVCMFASMCPTFAYAADDYKIFDIPMNVPLVDDSHSYIEFLIKQKDKEFYMSYVYYYNLSFFFNNSEEAAVLPTDDIILQFFTVTDSSATLTIRFVDIRYSCFMGLGVMNSSGTHYYDSDYFYYDSSGSDYSYSISFGDDWEIVGYHLNGDFFRVTDSLTSSIEFSNVYADDIPIYQTMLELISQIAILHSDNTEALNKLDLILSRCTSIQEILNSIYYDFSDLFFMLDDELLSILDAVDELEGNTDEIEGLLQQILDALNVKGESQFSEVDRSELDQYYEAESKLMTRVDVSGAMNIDINQNALTFCWNTVETFLNSNGKILTAVFVVLSIGLIAMFLGR